MKNIRYILMWDGDYMGENEDKRLRLIINFKNNKLEKQLYEYTKSQEVEGHSTYIKKLILKDMKDKGLLK